MKIQKASFGIIEQLHAGKRLFLLQVSPSWGGALNLIGGKAKEGESAIQTALRELREELSIEYGQDYVFGKETPSVVELDQFSQRELMEKHYIFSVFWVVLLRPVAELEARLPKAPAHVWVTLEEIQSERASKGLPISPTVWKVLSRLL